MYDKAVISTLILIACLIIAAFFSLKLFLSNSNEEKNIKNLIISIIACIVLAPLAYLFLPIPEYQPNINLDNPLINDPTLNINIDSFKIRFNTFSKVNDQNHTLKHNLYITNISSNNKSFQININPYISISGTIDDFSNDINKIYIKFITSPNNKLSNILLVMKFTLQTLHPNISYSDIDHYVNSLILPEINDITDLNKKTETNNTITYDKIKYTAHLTKQNTIILIEPMHFSI